MVVPQTPVARPKLLKASQPRTRGQTALSLAIELTDDLDEVDLDVIDGEFYWRCCRIDLLDRLEAVCKERPRPIGARANSLLRPESEDDLSGLIEPAEATAYLRDGLRYANEIGDLVDRAASLYPDAVWPRILDGERVSMRAVAAEHRPHGCRGIDGPAVHLKVFSGSWTGEKVEEELRRIVNTDPRMATRRSAPDPASVQVRLGFALQVPGSAPEQSHAEVPHVSIVAALPLPPKGTIAREYDELVVRNEGWADSLPGWSGRQDKRIAIRTWAVSLIMAGGCSFREAMERVSGATGIGYVSQTRSNRDRVALVRRVPEAQKYVYARSSKDDGNAGPAHQARDSESSTAIFVGSATLDIASEVANLSAS